jgi:orotidine-5'-phosphate decarboxylase
MTELAAREQIILAIDTSETAEAERLARVAQEAGARFVKLGLELASATSWNYCSELAGDHGLDWVADAKLDDIPNTVEGSVRNIARLEHQPFGITMHTTAGAESMRIAQETAGEAIMFGVTILTSIEDKEAAKLYGARVTPADVMILHDMISALKADDEESLRAQQQEVIDGYYEEKAEEAVREKVLELARNAASVGMRGFVSSPREVNIIKSDPVAGELFGMIPGIRSASAGAQDQSRIGTPAGAIGNGADLLVIGRQITQAPEPAEAYEAVVAEIMGAK